MAEALRIRPVRQADLPTILAWRNHPDVRTHMLTRHEISLSEHEAWFAKAGQDPTRALRIVEEAGQPLGYVQFTGVQPGGIGDWGFYACPDAPKGSGRKLGQIALRHAFADLHLHKVCGQAFLTNQASIRMHEALGFQREGLLRDQHRIGRDYISLVCFGLLHTEWRARSNRKSAPDQIGEMA